MKPSYYRISLDVHDATSQLSFSIKKGDTSRRLLISLMDNGVPYVIEKDCYAVFYARKPDGTQVANDCSIKNNKIVYDITKQTTLIEGRLDCEITLYGANAEQLTSPRFTMIVYASVYTEEEVESSDEYKSLHTLISEGNELIRTVETKLANGDFVGEKGEQGEKGEKGEQGDICDLSQKDLDAITNQLNEHTAEFEALVTDHEERVSAVESILNEHTAEFEALVTAHEERVSAVENMMPTIEEEY